MRVPAPAKVNLRLNVLAREASGYHQIETVFCALELADDVEVRLGGSTPAGAAPIALHVSGHDVPRGEANLAHRAASAFIRRAGVTPTASIRVRKRIPVAAGLGGGSSDAAATLRALNEAVGEPLSAAVLLELGASLGADVPFFLSGSPLALAWGRGDRLLPLPPLPRRPVLIAVPPFSSPTAEAYALLAGHRGDRRGEAATLDLARLRDWDSIAADAANEFEAPLLARWGELEELRTALGRPPAVFALLAGSGSSIFAVFEDAEDRDRVASELARAFPRVRFLPTATAEGVPLVVPAVDRASRDR